MQSLNKELEEAFVSIHIPLYFVNAILLEFLMWYPA